MYDIKETFRANSVPEALELLRAHPGAIPVCGGTDVMIHLKERKLRQAALVGIMDIASLQGIYLEQTGDLFIGSGTCFDSIYQNPLASVRADVGRRLQSGGKPPDPQRRDHRRQSLQRRSQRRQCAVASGTERRAGADVAGRKTGGKGGGLPYRAGKNRTGNGPRAFDRHSHSQASYEGHGGKYLKFGQRNAMEIATLGCAVNCALSPDGTIRDFAIAFGVAAPRPIRCAKAESLMLGRRPTGALLKELRRAVLLECAPRESWRASLELRTQLIQELAERASRCAIEHAGGNLDD